MGGGSAGRRRNAGRVQSRSSAIRPSEGEYFTTMVVGSSGSGDLIFLTWIPEGEQQGLDSVVRDAYAEILRVLDERKAVPLQERVFCDLEAADTVVSARAEVLSDSISDRIPPTVVEGFPAFGGSIAGIHVIAARPSTSGSVNSVTWRGSSCGRWISGEDADYFGLSDVGRLADAPSPISAADQTRDALLLALELLGVSGWSFGDVCRTWFYLDDILSWYDDFNLARNDVFTDLGLLDGDHTGVIPASTGIRGRNPRGHRCTLDLLAVRARPGRELAIDTLHNPLQNEAPEYGSAFSRGLTVTTRRDRTFLVSGTASIDEGGATVYPGDFDSQTVRTLDNIEALLGSRGATMNDICQATAFVKQRDDGRRLLAILNARGLGDLPLVCTVDDICRDDLLVEIDATAVIPWSSPDNS